MQRLINKNCLRCKHRYRMTDDKRVFCVAFLEGIPEEILEGKIDHNKPLPNQKNNIVFEPLSKENTEKSKQNDIQKAWKAAQVGEVRTRKDGKKYKKVASTGNKDTDWKLVTDAKSGKKEEESSPKSKKQESEGEKKTSDKELTEAAKNASETALNNAIKESGDPKMREAAHEEMKRRESEEKPQEEKESDQPGADSEKKPSDEEAASASSKKESKDTTKETEKKFKQSERKVSLEEYRKGFEDFSQKSFKEVSEFYEKDASDVKEYLDRDFMAKKALDFYIEDGHEQIRNFLSSGEIEEKTHDLKDGFSISINKDNISGLANNVSKVINDNKIKEDLSINRRVKGDGVKFFQGLEKGEVYEDKSFSSTSLKELEKFGEFNIEILAKKGSSVANLGNRGEYEYLIDKGSKFRVLDKTDNGIIVELL